MGGKLNLHAERSSKRFSYIKSTVVPCLTREKKYILKKKRKLNRKKLNSNTEVIYLIASKY